MRYATIRKVDVSNGPYIGVSLFLQGCNFHCKNCFNQVAWPLDGGYEFTEEIKKEFLDLISGVRRVSILGGEPMLQAEELYDLLKEIKNKWPEKEIWLWTGYYLRELDEVQKKTLTLCDYVVDGRYEDELKDRKIRFRGSSNQTVWKNNGNGEFIESDYNKERLD